MKSHREINYCGGGAILFRVNSVSVMRVCLSSIAVLLMVDLCLVVSAYAQGNEQSLPPQQQQQPSATETEKPAFAFVTLVTAPEADQLVAAEALAKSLHSVETRAALVCLAHDILIPRDLLGQARDPASDDRKHIFLDRLRLAGWSVRFVQAVEDPNPTAAATSTYFIGSSYSKLHVFQLTEFERVVFIERDAVVLSNIDDLFTQPIAEIAAVPNIFPPDRFNTGFMIIRPSLAIFQEMVQLLTAERAALAGAGVADHKRFSMFGSSEEILLNSYFNKWYGERTDMLPFGFNVPIVVSSEPQLWKELVQGEQLKVVRFSSKASLPWNSSSPISFENAAVYHLWRRFQACAHDHWLEHERYLAGLQEYKTLWEDSKASSSVHPWHSLPPNWLIYNAFAKFRLSVPQVQQILLTEDQNTIREWFDPAKQQPSLKVEL